MLHGKSTGLNCAQKIVLLSIQEVTSCELHLACISKSLMGETMDLINGQFANVGGSTEFFYSISDNNVFTND